MTECSCDEEVKESLRRDLRDFLPHLDIIRYGTCDGED